MSDYRRYFIPGAMYFFTVVTYQRRPILTMDAGRQCLRNAISEIKQNRPFDLFATVLLPDHWHWVMALPSGDADYSTRIKRIKETFSEAWLAAGMPESPVTPAQKKKGMRGIWQPRFWEHTIRDEADLERCVDYTHWNPRKHEVVRRVQDWPWSSFHRFVEAGQYDLDWGGEIPKAVTDKCEWGEP
ncbi:REP-associated tyrosine transposase [Novipirellula artificiosorum]|uniref:Transposase IS200 like protein n=1 Tax=Novipirellula artificiosorum TaxID=2528016 RepID=A0A5C6DU40_9BACT|nr:transposase [Novipirellula artificiosorum]TWU39744.1 Transposase IS200 like protein [Novipirellula artificiosorum]